MFIDYAETRELVGSGDSEIETDASEINRDMEVDGGESVSLSGVGRESQLNRIEYVWRVTTIPISVDDLPRWREFAASVANGESFTFDAFGTSASPDNAISVSMVQKSFKENRYSKMYMTFSFAVIEL